MGDALAGTGRHAWLWGGVFASHILVLQRLGSRCFRLYAPRGKVKGHSTVLLTEVKMLELTAFSPGNTDLIRRLEVMEG